MYVPDSSSADSSSTSSPSDKAKRRKEKPLPSELPTPQRRRRNKMKDRLASAFRSRPSSRASRSKKPAASAAKRVRKLADQPLYRIGLFLFFLSLAFYAVSSNSDFLYGLAWILSFTAHGLVLIKIVCASYKRWGNITAVALWAGLTFLIGVLFLMFAQGAVIYAEFGRSLSPEQSIIPIGSLGAGFVGSWGPIGWGLSKLLSVIAAFLRNLQLTSFALLGLCTYTLVSVLEVSPVILRSSPVVMDNVMKSMSQFTPYKRTGNETGALLDLADDYDNYFSDLLRFLKVGRACAYLVDILVIVLHTDHFFLVGPWSEVKFTFGMHSIDWSSVGRAIILVGFLELVARLTLNAWKWYRLSLGKNY